MSFSKITDLLKQMSKVAEDSEDLLVSPVVAKLDRLVEAYPHDHTVVGMHKVLSKMNEKNTLLVSRATFKDLYTKFYTRDSRFPDHFAAELGTNRVVLAQSVKVAAVEPLTPEMYQPVDSTLVDALASRFQKAESTNSFDAKLTEAAKSEVSNCLESWNIRASKLSVDAGNSKFIAVRADYNTPKGITSIIVPVNVSGKTVVATDVFLSNDGASDLNHRNIKSYVVAQAGRPLKISAAQVVSTLTEKFYPAEKLSDAEMALARVNAAEAGGNDVNQMFGALDPVSTYSEVQIERSPLADTYEAQLSSAAGTANLRFGKNVNIAASVIDRELRGYGFKNSHIAVASTDNDTIYFGVKLPNGRAAFSVPVKIEAGKVVAPELIVCNGSMSDFSKKSVLKIFATDSFDVRSGATTSASYGLKPSELVNTVQDAMVEGNLAKAEDALNVLRAGDDELAYKSAFTYYMNGLKTTKEVEPTVSCDKVIRLASSVSPICSHTGLPLSKVYTDKHGNCRPLHRKGSEETMETAYLSTGNILGS
jgi:hypothetical protein